MIDITANIRDLLFKHDCVILPSFGGFIGNYRPAQIDGSTNTFTPPVKAISFNRNLTHNDGLIIGKISEERKIGYADSKSIVEEFVAGLKTRLDKGERVSFERIGYFQTNSEGNIEFEPDRDTNFLLDSYGFSSFKREALPGFDITRRISGRDLDSIQSNRTRKMVWRAVIAIPFIAAMILVPLKTDLLKNNASLNPLTSIEGTDANITSNQAQKETIVASDEILITEQDDLIEASDITEEVQDKTLYYIVTGSFKSQDYALKMIEEAEEKGFRSAELSKTDNGFYRVLIDSYTIKEDAITLRKSILAEYPDCWILAK